MKDDPEKDIFTLIDIARSGDASEDMIEYIRNKQVLKKGTCIMFDDVQENLSKLREKIENEDRIKKSC